jgi:hypothetical protein
MKKKKWTLAVNDVHLIAFTRLFPIGWMTCLALSHDGDETMDKSAWLLLVEALDRMWTVMMYFSFKQVDSAVGRLRKNR